MILIEVKLVFDHIRVRSLHLCRFFLLDMLIMCENFILAAITNVESAENGQFYNYIYLTPVYLCDIFTLVIKSLKA
ncbi:hypothetical protein D3C76_438160 [compost metagenome]